MPTLTKTARQVTPQAVRFQKNETRAIQTQGGALRCGQDADAASVRDVRRRTGLFRCAVALFGGCGLGMLQLVVGRSGSAPARFLSSSTMPKKAGTMSKASGKSHGVERVGHGATPAGNGSSAWRVEDRVQV